MSAHGRKRFLAVKSCFCLPLSEGGNISPENANECLFQQRTWHFYPEVPEYPFHDRTIQVTQCGRLCIGSRKINLSTVFAGQHVGIREVADEIWLVSFLDYDLGFFDQKENRVEPVGENPFPPKVLPM